MRDASRQQPGSMSSHSHPQPVKLGFCRLKLYHVLFDEAATMAVHFNTSLHHRLKKKKLSKLLKYVSDSWKHTWEKLAPLSRPQQIHKLKQIYREIHPNCTLAWAVSWKILNPFSSHIQVWVQHKYGSKWVPSANWKHWAAPDVCLTNTKGK